MKSFKTGWVENSNGGHKDVVVKDSNQRRGWLFAVLAVVDLAIVALSNMSFKQGAYAQDAAEFTALDDLGLINANDAIEDYKRG